MTDQTSDQAPGEVDLTAAGVSGWVLVLQQIKQQKAALEEAEQQAKEKIQAALGNNVDGTIDGRPVVRWSHTAAPRQFNKKRFAKDHPDLLRQYTTFGEPGRRFELVTPKGDE